MVYDRVSTADRINAALFVAVVAVGLYLVIAPLGPDLVYYVKRYSSGHQSYSYQKSTDFRSNDIEQLQLFEGEKPPPVGDNLLFIPKIGVNSTIHEGAKALTLEKGIWHRPKSSSPDLGSNTVFVAHRFLYTSGPNTFYHLDKLAAGDRFSVWWGGKRFEYEVSETKTVSPLAIEVEAPSTDNVVTLWTCTPLFKANKRLVVMAKLVRKDL